MTSVVETDVKLTALLGVGSSSKLGIVNCNSFWLPEKCEIVNQKMIPFSILLATIPESIPEKMLKMAKESEL